MGKISFLFLTLMLSFTAYASNVNAKLTEGEAVEIITKDFIMSHKIQVDGYNYISNKEFAPNKDNLTTEQKSLSHILVNIAEPQIGGDCSPVFYLNKENKKGYVLEKKLSGINNLYSISFDDKKQNWKITNKSSKKGTDLVDLGLLKDAN
ncbi:hypothetical protein WMO40_17365 [Bacillaceae bacterium CLA-AA-H227]|uniref:Uncharacterized protein n=1 Tax=Robertmurraya yapensis (ex Hitch et al 2024) TaxID=3133160 RepID=A0ACC6SF24_9BACI